MSRDNRQAYISKCTRGGLGGGEMGREGEGGTEEAVGGGRQTHALDFFSSTLTNTLPGPNDQSNTIPPITHACVKVRCRCKFKNTWS